MVADVLRMVRQVVEQAIQVDTGHLEVQSGGLALVVAGPADFVAGACLDRGDAVAAGVDDDTGVDAHQTASSGDEGSHDRAVVDDDIHELAHEPDVRPGFGDHLLYDDLADLEVLGPGVTGVAGDSGGGARRQHPVVVLQGDAAHHQFTRRLHPMAALAGRPETDGPHHHRSAPMRSSEERQVLGENGLGPVSGRGDGNHESRRSPSDDQHIRSAPVLQVTVEMPGDGGWNQIGDLRGNKGSDGPDSVGMPRRRWPSVALGPLTPAGSGSRRCPRIDAAR